MEQATRVNLDEIKLNTASDEGIVVDILHPVSHAPIGAKITVCGIDSERYRKVQREQQNRRMRSMQKNRNYRMTADEIEHETLTALATCTVTWSGVAMGGKDVEPSTENFYDVYSKYSWIREQVEEAMADRSNFTKA